VSNFRGWVRSFLLNYKIIGGMVVGSVTSVPLWLKMGVGWSESSIDKDEFIPYDYSKRRIYVNVTNSFLYAFPRN
jgi:hypothetical protein